MRSLWGVCLLAGVMGLPHDAWACTPSYQIKPGDSLSKIAEAQYQNAFLWNEIYTANRSVIGPDPDKILVGSVLQLSCPAEEDAPIEALAVDQSIKPPSTSQTTHLTLRLRTGDGLPPFTDEASPAGGFLVELMRDLVVSDASVQRESKIERVAWSALAQPGTEEQANLWAFPVAKPDCGADVTARFCGEWTMSLPVLEVLTVLYFRSGEAPLSEQARDLQGRTVCQAEGLAVDALDTPARRWISDGVISVQRAATTADCFVALWDNRVDAVLTNEFTGRVLSEILLPDGFSEPEVRTLGTEMMHAAVRGGIQQAEELNRALVQTRRDGRFDGLMRKHLAGLWAGL